jgi:flagellar L-ring protein FlgH
MRSTILGLLALTLALAQPSLATAQAAPADTDRPRQSWTSDRRAFAVGDVITILVDEFTLASANKGDFASDRRTRDLGVGVTQNVTSTVPDVRGNVSSTNAAESRRRGEAVRQNRFQGEMTARVMEVTPGGLLRLEGRKLLHIDDAREELSVAGWVRPQDISSRNQVDSWRIADAELVYTSSAALGRPRGGILGRVLGRIWP